jgi:maltose O-acetyltransferase
VLALLAGPCSMAFMRSPSRWQRGFEAMRARVLDEFAFDVRKEIGRVVSHALPHLSFNRTRTAVLRALGVKVGERSLIMGPVDLSGPGSSPELLSIGDDTFITGPLRVDLGGPVRIGNRVRLGHDVALLTRNHEIGASAFRCGLTTMGSIDIGDGVWIASRVTILPGVTIGKGAVIASGAVVTRTVPPDTLVAGVPARIVRTLGQDGGDASVLSERG